MALNIGTVNFNLDANTRGLQNAVKKVEEFRKVVNAAANDTTRAGQATANAFGRQESAMKRAFQQTLNLQRSVRQSVSDEVRRRQMLSQTTNAYRLLVREMTSGRLSTVEFTRSIDAFNARLNRTNREVKNIQQNKFATTLGKWGRAFRELESSAVLALGPLSGVGARFRALGALMGRTSTIMVGVFVGAAVLVTTALYKMAAAAIKASMEYERLMARFTSAAGGDVAQGAKDFQFVSSTAQQLGLKITDLAKSYSRLSAASAGTVLEGAHAENIFYAVAEAAAALRLESTEVEGAFRAIEQMVSKGNVQAEELRGQLGERLPGAFQLAAKAMGVSTRELDRMLRRGEIAATDLLPKLARVIHETYGESALKNLESMNGLQNKMTNTLFDLKIAFGSTTGATNLYGQALKIINEILESLVRNIDWVKLPAVGLLSVFWGWVAIFKTLKVLGGLVFAGMAKALAYLIEAAVEFGNILKDIFHVDAAEMRATIADLEERLKKATLPRQQESLEGQIERAKKSLADLESRAPQQLFQVPDFVSELRNVGQDLSRHALEGMADLGEFAMEGTPLQAWWEDLGKFNSILGTTEAAFKNLTDPDVANTSTQFDNLVNKIKDMRQETEGFQATMTAIGSAQSGDDIFMVKALVDAVQAMRTLGKNNDDLLEMSHYLEMVGASEEELTRKIAEEWAAHARAAKEAQDHMRALERMPEIEREVAAEFVNVAREIQATKMGPIFAEWAASAQEVERKLEAMRDKLEQGTFSKEEIDTIIAAYRELLVIQDEEERKAARFVNLSADFAKRIGDAFSDAIFEGEKLSDVLNNLIKDLIRLAVQKSVLDPFVDGLTAAFGGMMGGSSQSIGQLFMAGFKGVTANAKGGLTKGPTMFSKGGKTGMMGEAGTEAIMPLGRTSSGDLGVKVTGGTAMEGDQRPIHVIQNFHFDVGLESVDARIAQVAPQIASSAQIGFSKALRRPKMA